MIDMFLQSTVVNDIMESIEQEAASGGPIGKSDEMIAATILDIADMADYERRRTREESRTANLGSDDFIFATGRKRIPLGQLFNYLSSYANEVISRCQNDGFASHPKLKQIFEQLPLSADGRSVNLARTDESVMPVAHALLEVAKTYVREVNAEANTGDHAAKRTSAPVVKPAPEIPAVRYGKRDAII